MDFARSARTTVQRQPVGSPQSSAKTHGVARQPSTPFTRYYHENSHPNALGYDLAAHAYALSPTKSPAAAREPPLAMTAGAGPKSWLADAASDRKEGQSERICSACTFANLEKGSETSKAPHGTRTGGQGYCTQQGTEAASCLGNRQIPHLHSTSNLRYTIYSPRNRADLAAY